MPGRPLLGARLGARDAHSDREAFVADEPGQMRALIEGFGSPVVLLG